MLLALEYYRAHGHAVYTVPDGLPGFLSHHDLARPGHIAKTFGNVHPVADNGEVHPFRRTDISRNNLSGLDADAKLQLQTVFRRARGV